MLPVKSVVPYSGLTMKLKVSDTHARKKLKLYIGNGERNGVMCDEITSSRKIYWFSSYLIFKTQTSLEVLNHGEQAIGNRGDAFDEQHIFLFVGDEAFDDLSSIRTR